MEIALSIYVSIYTVLSLSLYILSVHHVSYKQKVYCFEMHKID